MDVVLACEQVDAPVCAHACVSPVTGVLRMFRRWFSCVLCVLLGLYQHLQKHREVTGTAPESNTWLREGLVSLGHPFVFSRSQVSHGALVTFVTFEGVHRGWCVGEFWCRSKSGLLMVWSGYCSSDVLQLWLDSSLFHLKRAALLCGSALRLTWRQVCQCRSNAPHRLGGTNRSTVVWVCSGERTTNQRKLRKGHFLVLPFMYTN